MTTLQGSNNALYIAHSFITTDPGDNPYTRQPDPKGSSSALDITLLLILRVTLPHLGDYMWMTLRLVPLSCYGHDINNIHLLNVRSEVYRWYRLITTMVSLWIYIYLLYNHSIMKLSALAGNIHHLSFFKFISYLIYEFMDQ